jgi:hypothetical protein
MRSLAALLLVVVGCAGQEGPAGPPGPPGEDGTDGTDGADGTTGEPAEGFTSGQRIKARSTTTITSTADGAMRSVTTFGGWFDSARNEECTPQLASDGKTRCMPVSIPATTDYYADAACTAVLALTLDSSCTPSLPMYVRLPVPASCPQTVGGKLHARGATTTAYYTKSGANCTGPMTLAGFTWHMVGAEVPASSFAEMTVTTETE